MSNLRRTQFLRCTAKLSKFIALVLMLILPGFVVFAAPRPVKDPTSNPPAGCRRSGRNNHVRTRNIAAQTPIADREFEIEVYLFLGNKARDASNYPEAEKHYLHVRDLKSDEWRAHYGLANVYFDLSFAERDEPSTTEAPTMAKAISEYLLATSLAMSDPYADDAEVAELHSDLAQAYLHRDMISQARREVEIALRKNQKSASAIRRLGKIFYKEKKYSEAIKTYEESLKIAQSALTSEALKREQSALTYEALGAVILEQSKPPGSQQPVNKVLEDLALSKFKEAVRLKPDYIFGYQTLGEFYLNRGKYADAIGPFKQALGLNNNLVLTRARLVLAYYHAGKLSDARREFVILKGQSLKRADEIRPEIGPGFRDL